MATDVAPAHRGTYVMVGAGSLVAAPPGVAHSLRNAGARRARWLTIHADDGGQIEWDIAPVPRTAWTPSAAI